MNPSFENIFEKFNVACEVPKKRRKVYKIAQSHSYDTHHKKEKNTSSQMHKSVEDLISNRLPNTHKSLDLKSSCYFKTNKKGKYCNPIRYKTLDIIGVENVLKHNTSITESTSFSDINTESVCNSKENYNEQIGKRNFSSHSFNTRKSKQICKNRAYSQCLSYKQLNITAIPKSKTFSNSFEKQPKFKCATMNKSDSSCREPFQPLESNCQKLSQTKAAGSAITELDLLIDLIQQDEKNNVESPNLSSKFLNSDDNVQCTKSCLKGGYEELFERAIKHEKVKSNFLKYDKKIGLLNGQLFTTVNIETSYGLTLATVKSEELNKNFAIVVASEMTPRLKIGTQIEAFFDDKTLPYKLEINGESLDIYLEPYKLLIS